MKNIYKIKTEQTEMHWTQCSQNLELKKILKAVRQQQNITLTKESAEHKTFHQKQWIQTRQ